MSITIREVRLFTLLQFNVRLEGEGVDQRQLGSGHQSEVGLFPAHLTEDQGVRVDETAGLRHLRDLFGLRPRSRRQEEVSRALAHHERPLDPTLLQRIVHHVGFDVSLQIEKRDVAVCAGRLSAKSVEEIVRKYSVTEIGILVTEAARPGGKHDRHALGFSEFGEGPRAVRGFCAGIVPAGIDEHELASGPALVHQLQHVVHGQPFLFDGLGRGTDGHQIVVFAALKPMSAEREEQRSLVIAVEQLLGIVEGLPEVIRGAFSRSNQDNGEALSFELCLQLQGIYKGVLESR